MYIYTLFNILALVRKLVNQLKKLYTQILTK